MTGRLIGVGVGPGDPELVTVKAVRLLREADAVFVPVAAGGEPGRAETVVCAYVAAARVRRVEFALGDDPSAREANWAVAAEAVAAVLRAGQTAAFATIGDPSVYSTFAYLAAAVRGLLPGVRVELAPGITAMQDLAARSGTSLVEGSERLALLPFGASAGDLAAFDTVVCYKGGRQLPEILQALRAAGRLDQAVYGARLGLPGEVICRAADLPDPTATGPYLSTLIVPPAGPRRREGERSR